MHKIELEKQYLGRYANAIESAAQSCLVGAPVERETGSYLGGMPMVERGFEWPTKEGYPLDFIGQLRCGDLDLPAFPEGDLLFFYDNRHCGYSPKDRGHAVVIHQQSGEPLLVESELPEYEVRSFLGLSKKRVKPRVYQRVDVIFVEGCSYPSLERQLIPFKDDVSEACYVEFLDSVRSNIQIGGYPSPVQSDEMEKDCVKAFGLGQPSEWRLLLQLGEVGNMVWGDAGSLYWFIHEEDLRVGRLDRVWMVMQCC